MTPDEFRAEIEWLGLRRTGEGTDLVEEYEMGDTLVYLPRPETIDTDDRIEAMKILKMTLGIGVVHGPH